MQGLELFINGLAAFGTLIAVMIASRAEARARSAERRASAGVVRERRLTYELDLLSDIAEQMSRADLGSKQWYPRLRIMLIALPGHTDLPLLRAFTGARPTPLGLRHLDALVSELVASGDGRLGTDPHRLRRTQLRALRSTGWRGVSWWEAELVKAINRRLTER